MIIAGVQIDVLALLIISAFFGKNFKSKERSMNAKTSAFYDQRPQQL